ncbi:putative Meiotically up-regulated gene 113-domain-containing protein [Seiridium unicorne]|uniref:Meiotically up-regulated gene 113-domain-containing protein n=1 Tax=Seiridium unicorne TaxID=138068 RepID=A0ABR2VII3_9PEZI
MPFIPNTPESLLGRSDSKNPDTTCRGITSSGRPCRRPLAASPSASPAASRMRINKQQLRADDPADPELYCWQHKDQASLSAKSSPGPRTNTTPILEQRESLDTLIDRLGIVEAQQKKKKSGREGRNSAGGNNGHAGEKITQTGQGSVEKPPKRKTNAKKQSTFCCCFTIPVYEEERPARPKPRPIQSAPAAAAAGSAKLPSNQYLAPPSAGSRPSATNSSRRASAQSTMSQTSQYLQIIPPHASPQTASQLMAELAKPISQQDEAGYIYIFWLTPESQPSTPPADAARDLLAPPAARPNGRQRRTSDVLQSYANQKDNSSKTILLKIGRASNVQRRLNEWSRQCGYNLSLIRYYPYISNSTPSTPRKMPHSHKVERLIHIELAGAGLRISDRKNCEACGKAHREWFEVDATRKGIEMVDEVVKRWSDWDEGRG